MRGIKFRCYDFVEKKMCHGADRDKNHGIIWSNYNSCWCLGGEESSPMRKYQTKEFWEVAGNIYENPEMK